MAAIATGPAPALGPVLLPLENGDHLDQKTFHARYEAMPEDFRAELIGGIVYVSSPLKRPHSRGHVMLIRWLGEYEDATPGVEVHDNATAILSEENEPQPDANLIITTPGLGQTREEDEYIVGPPEFAGEVASSTASIDLHRKRAEYEKEGIKEYLVVVLKPPRVVWYVSRQGRFEELAAGPDGILRSEVFPGLWLDPAALLQRDTQRLRAVLQQGVATPEHQEFAAKLRGAEWNKK